MANFTALNWGHALKGTALSRGHHSLHSNRLVVRRDAYTKAYIQSWSLISAVPCQATIPALKWDPALSREGAVQR